MASYRSIVTVSVSGLLVASLLSIMC